MADRNDNENCAWMVALGLVVRDGYITPVGTREEVKAGIVASMTAAARLYQKHEGVGIATDPALRADLQELMEEFQDDEAHNPVRLALLEGRDLFERIADLIFLPDPPYCNIRQLPRDTFSGVPYFFDLRDLAKAASYDISSLGFEIDGETGERAVAFNRDVAEGGRAGSGAAGSQTRTQPPQPAQDFQRQISGMMQNY